MKNLRTLICGLAIFALGAIALRADEWDKKTVIRVNETIEIAGTSLPPGTYVLMLDRGSQAERHIVRIKDAAAQKLITTVIAHPNYRVNVTSEPQLTFWEVPKGNPSALRAWFWPGDHWGQEFPRPGQGMQLAAAVPPPEPAPAVMENKVMEHEQVAQVAAPTPEQPAVITPEQEPTQEIAKQPAVTTPEQEPTQEIAQQPTKELPMRELPKTGSNLPLVGLVGLLSLAAGLLFRVCQRVGVRQS